jgi:hypothetical protein
VIMVVVVMVIVRMFMIVTMYNRMFIAVATAGSTHF